MNSSLSWFNIFAFVTLGRQISVDFSTILQTYHALRCNPALQRKWNLPVIALNASDGAVRAVGTDERFTLVLLKQDVKLSAVFLLECSEL